MKVFNVFYQCNTHTEAKFNKAVILNNYKYS